MNIQLLSYSLVTETLTLHRDHFEELRRSSPAIDRFLIQVLAAEVIRLDGQLVEALFVPVEKRVLRRLCMLADEYGGGVPGTIVPLTQEDVATMAGTTRPTANRVLRAAEELGIVRVGRNRLEILDPAALAHRAR